MSEPFVEWKVDTTLTWEADVAILFEPSIRRAAPWWGRSQGRWSDGGKKARRYRRFRDRRGRRQRVADDTKLPALESLVPAERAGTAPAARLSACPASQEDRRFYLSIHFEHRFRDSAVSMPPPRNGSRSDAVLMDVDSVAACGKGHGMHQTGKGKGHRFGNQGDYAQPNNSVSRNARPRSMWRRLRGRCERGSSIARRRYGASLSLCNPIRLRALRQAEALLIWCEIGADGLTAEIRRTGRCWWRPALQFGVLIHCKPVGGDPALLRRANA